MHLFGSRAFRRVAAVQGCGRSHGRGRASYVTLQSWLERSRALMNRITWTQDNVAGVPLSRYVGHVGGIEVGNISYDGSNRF